MTTVYANLMTPRSGSTLIQLMMYYYLKGKYNNCINLKNYFNKWHYNMYFKPMLDENGKYIGKKNYDKWVPGSYREDAYLDRHARLIYNYNVNDKEPYRDIQEETEHRLNCIVGSDIGWTYCFKLHTFPDLNPVYRRAIEDDWLVVCTERDPYSQILEYFISMKMQIWAFFESSDEEIKKYLPEPDSITVSRENIHNFLERIKYYQTIRDKITNKIVIKYSDLEKIESVWDAYPLLGFDDWELHINKSEVAKELPNKIPFGDLESYFSNLNDIKNWYERWMTQNPLP